MKKNERILINNFLNNLNNEKKILINNFLNNFEFNRICDKNWSDITDEFFELIIDLENLN